MWQQQEGLGWPREETQPTHKLNRIRWLQTKRMSDKDPEISQWQPSDPAVTTTNKNRSKKRQHTKNSQTSKKYTYLLHVLNQEDESIQQQKSFEKYDKLPSYRLQRPTEEAISPRKVNLNLPLPRSLEMQQAHWRDSSLPLIKKVAAPVHSWRIEQRRSKDLMQSMSEVIGSELRQSQSGRTGLMGQTRRPFKSFNRKQVGHSLAETRLRECITFRK